jgi:uncharacterized protein YcfL
MNRIPVKIAALLLLVTIVPSLAMLTGCLSKAKKVSSQTALDTETVVMKDLAVTSNVSLKKEWSETVNGMLKANIILRNDRNTTVKLEIKTVFKDSNGVPLKTTTDTWAPVNISSNEDYHYSKLCPVSGASGYQFIIRTAGK